jgi:hypothetical protein
MSAVVTQATRVSGLRGIEDLREALEASGIQVTLDPADQNEGCLSANVPDEQQSRLLQLCVATLQRSGYRVCFERRGTVWSVFAFPTRQGQGVHLKLRATPGHSVRRLFDLAPRIAPHFALVGPDGVGKSTVLRLVMERIRAEAPFLRASVKQWRPGLLPSLASLAGRPEATEGEASDFRPRRDPGNLQLLRLGYYGLDFIAGAYWKHRQDSQPRFIVYDRCALDMMVDPYRFNLHSRWGTHTLWRIIPKPTGIILLHDDGNRIASRKDDLTLQEIQGQMTLWLDLVKRGVVNSVVRVEDNPRETANRVYQALIEQFLGYHEQSCPKDSAEILQPVQGTLFEAREHQHREPYGLFPNRTDIRFLIPLSDSSASAKGLDLYHAQKPLARLAKSLLTNAFRTGALSHLWPHRTQLCTGDLERRFRDLLGQQVRLAFSLGSGKVRNRVIIQITTPDGEILAYAKAGFDESSQTAIQREEQTLRSLEHAGFSPAEVPQVLRSFAWRDAWILTETAAPQEKQPAHAFRDEHVQFLTRLATRLPCHTPADGLSPDSPAHLEHLGYPYYADLIKWATNHLASFPALPGSFLHGDFTPWNLSVSRNRVFAFDWEQAAHRGPAGWDAFHFCVASSIEVRGQHGAQTFRDIMNPGGTHQMLRKYFEAAGIHSSWFEPLFIRYLAGALTNSIFADPAGADGKEEAVRRAWAFLIVLMRHCVALKAGDEVSR